MKCKVIYSLLVTLLFTSAQAANLSLEHFKAIGNDINRNPHPVYLQLLEIEKSKQSMSKQAKLWLLYRKAQAENLLYFHEKFDETVNKARALIDESTPMEIQASFNVFAGIAAQRRGEYQEAVSLIRQAMSQAQAENLNYIYTEAKQELAYTLSLTELYETSLADLQEAYVEAFALNDNFLIAVINETYAAVFGYMNDFEKSIEYYARALDTYERLGYQPYVAEAIYGLASTYRYWKKYDLAIEKFKLYMDKVSYTPNQYISYFGAYGLGMTYAEKGDCPAALVVIEQALALNGQVDYDAELLKRRAQCQINLGKLVEAGQSIAQAEAIFSAIPELDGTKWAIETIKLRGLLANAKGEYQQAYQLTQSYYQQFTELLIANSSQQLMRVRSAMELERRNVEVSLLQQRNKVQELELKKQARENRFQIYLIIVAFLVIVLVCVIVYLQYRSNQKIFAMSITDPLSGMFNRRYIFEYLDRLIASNQTRQGDISVLLFDIDDFKQVNDNYGHPFGDEVICRIADISQETLRVGDIIGRIGGEEFFAILPRTDDEQAQAIAERLKNNIAQSLFTTEQGQQINITVSIGISALGQAASDRTALYVNADKALYQAKQQGKNQVVVYQ
ncbi:tetratricopeptide repeat-containing diguanylate cyclase [Colwellia sp. MEBiC06753]